MFTKCSGETGWKRYNEIKSLQLFCKVGTAIEKEIFHSFMQVAAKSLLISVISLYLSLFFLLHSYCQRLQ